MSPERVREIIASYNVNKGRKAHLSAEIVRLDKEYMRLQRALREALVSPKAQVITDMPRASGTGDKIGDIAVRFADGWEAPELREISAEKEKAYEELERVELEISYAEGWLGALPDRERLILKGQMVDRCTWRECAADYAERYGIELSRESMRRIRAEALKMIMRIAE